MSISLSITLTGRHTHTHTYTQPCRRLPLREEEAQTQLDVTHFLLSLLPVRDNALEFFQLSEPAQGFTVRHLTLMRQDLFSLLDEFCYARVQLENWHRCILAVCLIWCHQILCHQLHLLCILKIGRACIFPPNMVPNCMEYIIDYLDHILHMKLVICIQGPICIQINELMHEFIYIFAPWECDCLWSVLLRCLWPLWADRLCFLLLVATAPADTGPKSAARLPHHKANSRYRPRIAEQHLN